MSKNLDLNREIPVLDWDAHLADRTKSMQSSAIRELLKVTQDPEVISFAGGLPAPDVFPIEEVDEACSNVLRNLGKKALQYSATEGYYPLKEFLASSMHLSNRLQVLPFAPRRFCHRLSCLSLGTRSHRGSHRERPD